MTSTNTAVAMRCHTLTCFFMITPCVSWMASGWRPDERGPGRSLLHVIACVLSLVLASALADNTLRSSSLTLRHGHDPDDDQLHPRRHGADSRGGQTPRLKRVAVRPRSRADACGDGRRRQPTGNGDLGRRGRRLTGLACRGPRWGSGRPVHLIGLIGRLARTNTEEET